MNDVEIYLNLLKSQRDQLEIQLVQAAAKNSQLEELLKQRDAELEELKKPVEPKAKKAKKASDLEG